MAKRSFEMKSNRVRKRKHISGRGANVDQTESLSDVDDREVGGYLNTKEEIHLKRIIWEKLNQQFAHQMAQAKKAKKESDAKKAKSSKGTCNSSKGVESQTRSSSIINYDALKQLDDELNDDLREGGVFGGTGSRPHENNESDAQNLGVDESEDMYSEDVHEEDESYDDRDTWRYGNYESSYDDDTLGDTNYDEYDGEYYEADYENA